jgi:hypothetical protein
LARGFLWFGERLRFGTHHRRPSFRGDFENSFDPRFKSSGAAIFLPPFPAGARNRYRFRADWLLKPTVKLHPARAREITHVAEKLNVVPLQKREKIAPRMPSVADRVNADLIINLRRRTGPSDLSLMARHGAPDFLQGQGRPVAPTIFRKS